MKTLLEIIDTKGCEKILMKETRGGQRENAGRKSPFKEKTKGVKFMCPVSKVDEFKKYVHRKLAGWSKSGI